MRIAYYTVLLSTALWPLATASGQAYPHIEVYAEPTGMHMYETIVGMPLYFRWVNVPTGSAAKARWNCNGDLDPQGQDIWDNVPGSGPAPNYWVSFTPPTSPWVTYTYNTPGSYYAKSQVLSYDGSWREHFASAAVTVLDQANRPPVLVNSTNLVCYSDYPLAMLNFRKSYDPDQRYGDRIMQVRYDIGNNGSWEGGAAWESRPPDSVWLKGMPPGIIPMPIVLPSTPGDYRIAVELDEYYPAAPSVSVITVSVVQRPAGMPFSYPLWPCVWYNGASFIGVDYSHHDLYWLHLFNCIAREANFTGADLTQAVLTGTDLRYSKLTGAILRGADLTGANLRGVDFSGADLRNVMGLAGCTYDSTTTYSPTTLFDATGFDPEAAGWTLIPEPATLGLTALGVLAVMRRRRK